MFESDGFWTVIVIIVVIIAFIFTPIAHDGEGW